MKNNEILEGLYEAGCGAHRSTSFSPEKRAERIVEEYTAEILEDLNKLPEEQRERYTINYRMHLFQWLRSKSNCASTMITGGSNFNVSRNEKANRAEHNKYTAFREWRERVFKAIEKRTEREKSPEQKQAELWRVTEERIRSAAAIIQNIDAGIERGYSRQLFVSVIARNVTTAAKNGHAKNVENSLNLIKKLNEQSGKPIVSKKHKIFNLLTASQSIADQKTEWETKESKEYPFEGGKLVLNYQEKRVQIFHDEKPCFEKIQQIKRLAFKWAPSNKCWQRIYTDNALSAARQFLKACE